MFKSIIAWLDRDWEHRGYNPIFAVGQKLFWFSPLLLIGIIGIIAGVKPGDFLYDKGLLIGLGLCLIPFSISNYRWFRGYGRNSRNEEQTQKRKEGRG
ncbi:hypothetical protein P1X14_03535 [Sphingomonas sp. AOB5]|uniref:hypothetical protein n=1 Tax=Sphingomonas sp. AOB5 TaxID=3034017 RepID=UPI0023F902F6|nr:hypothetical protein [Sphingomonas sp. AOB5]MDF7774310.1 hypothetical protein [Sphingomonas sp. AOB5]